MRVLVTGRGSIAQRHARHLRDLIPNLDLAVISRASEVDLSFFPCTVFSHIGDALKWRPEAVVIASVSSQHAHELEICLSLGLPCLVEKPIAVSIEQIANLKKITQVQSFSTAVVVGCNLRYLPALQKFERALNAAVPFKVLRAHLQVGQALAQWRPARDLRTTYSADAATGGGVVFDLVHEIDAARWLFGPLNVHAAIGGHFSDLPIQSDDVHVALLKTASGTPVTVSLDYVSQQVVRKYDVVTDAGTFLLDIIGKTLVWHTLNAQQIVTDSPDDFDIGNTYALQMADWLKAIADPTHLVLSPLLDGFKTAELMINMKLAAS